MHDEKIKQKKRRTILAKLWKTIRLILLGLSAFLIIVFILLQFTLVQTFLATKLAEYLSEQTHSEISIERLKISGLLHVELNNLVVIDEEDTLMLDAQRIKINMNLPALMDNQLHVRL
jgi:uncharacterized protein YpmS